MTARPIGILPAQALTRPDDETGFGILRTGRGNLPLHRLDVRATITGLAAGVTVTQGFRNPYPEPLEATYIFPLPPRAALTKLTLTAADRTVVAELQERGQAREAYDQAIAAGQRAAIAEEERPDVFTLRVGNILPGEQVTVALELAQPLAVVDGEAEFRFPLVVAPRYIPGTALDGEQVGDGHAADTDAVPDASRISPPVLLPGFPNPVALSLRADLDPAGLELTDLRSSLHAVRDSDGGIEIQPGERLDRDFILRMRYAGGSRALVFSPDDTTGAAGTFQLVAYPPELPEAPRPRDLVLLLDRSGSMGGWKMVAARRAAARIVDTLRDGDRFAVLTFDTVVEWADGEIGKLVPASDRNRYRAVAHLSRAEARGGTELLQPLRDGLALLGGGVGGDRDKVLVLVTDGQVGNEDQILREVDAALAGVRVHTVGIDQAVNAGFLGRLAVAGRGRCELVESEERLDDAMARIHRRIGSPVVTGVTLDVGDLAVDGVTGLGDLFPGVPLVVAGRYTGQPAPLALRGRTPDDAAWTAQPQPTTVADAALTPVWARARLRDLEDRYAVTGDGALEKTIVDTSLRFGVLCRFTAYIAVDERVVTDGGTPHRVTQPVEQPRGWQPPAAAGAPMMSPMAFAMPASSPFQAPPVGGAPPASPGRSPRMRLGRAESAKMGPPPGTASPLPAPTGAVMRHFGVEAERVPAPSLHAVFASERATLVAADGAAVALRRDLLDDLASRLDAVSRDPGAGPHGAALRDLVALLRDESVPLDERWARALAVLEDLAGNGGTDPGTHTPPVQSKTGRRTGFWRRDA